jgi:23S rRNA (uridine2552-2'-O)-methyltransferase
MDALAGVEMILGDFREDAVLQQLTHLLPTRSVDVLLSDMAPNMSGNIAVDIPCAMYLAELAFDFGSKMLKPGGTLLMKIFHGAGFGDLIKQARLQYERVTIRKPLASRSRSRETYLLAKGYNL